jgi:hypothetical protein
VKPFADGREPDDLATVPTPEIPRDYQRRAEENFQLPHVANSVSKLSFFTERIVSSVITIISVAMPLCLQYA